MGKHGFGQLYKMESIIIYKISNMEQKAFAGMMSGGLKRTFRRISDSILYVVPPLLIGALVWIQADNYHGYLHRKRPEDFAKDA